MARCGARVDMSFGRRPMCTFESHMARCGARIDMSFGLRLMCTLSLRPNTLDT